MAEQSKAVQVLSPEQEQERLELLRNYHPQDHLAKWMAYNKQTNRSQEVVYYPASWRLYELSLRYPLANFDNEIYHMDPEKDFVIVRSRLYFGDEYSKSPKRAQAFKQGKLSELDRVETKAMARAARNFGIGTEHALDFDDLEADSTGVQPASNGHAVTVVEADKPALPAPKAHDIMDLYERGKVAGLWEKETFYATASSILNAVVSRENLKQLSPEQVNLLAQAIDEEQRDASVA